MSEHLAKAFHEAYERLAPSFGYKTREASAVPWEDVPEANRRLMTAVCSEVVFGRLGEATAILQDLAALRIPDRADPGIIDAVSRARVFVKGQDNG